MESADDVTQRLHQHLKAIARERDPYFAPLGHLAVQTYLQEHLSRWGEVERHQFTIQNRSHYNLILRIPGRGDPKSAPILVGAHYDAVPGTPGADDNATGVAVLLELARAIAQQQVQRPIWFVAFDLEEYGLSGSQAYAKHLVEYNQAIHLMLSLEMLGYCNAKPQSQRYPVPWLSHFYPDQGDFIALVGNLPAMPIMMQLSHHFHQAQTRSRWLPAGMKGQLLPDTRRSDHAPFWDMGYRAVMVTDTSFLRNPHYHRPSDRIETLDLAFLKGVYEGLLSALSIL